MYSTYISIYSQGFKFMGSGLPFQLGDQTQQSPVARIGG